MDRKNFNNNSFVYCAQGKLCWQMCCVRLVVKIESIRRQQKKIITRHAKIYYETQRLLFLLLSSQFYSTLNVVTRLHLPLLLIFPFCFLLLSHLRVRMYLCMLQSTSEYIDLTTVYGSTKKKIYLRANRKKTT